MNKIIVSDCASDSNLKKCERCHQYVSRLNGDPSLPQDICVRCADALAQTPMWIALIDAALVALNEAAFTKDVIDLGLTHSEELAAEAWRCSKAEEDINWWRK